MRVVVFFDLPVITSEEKRAYRLFRKKLLTMGFMMMQESVYCKLALNSNVADAIIYNLERERPGEGLVQVLKITEKQYEKMVFIVGDKKTDVLDTDERLVIL